MTTVDISASNRDLGESHGSSPTKFEWLLISLFPGGTALGLLLAWRWEGLGGILSLLCTATFLVVSPEMWKNPWFMTCLISAVLFALAWVVKPREQNVT